jgi:hypothetical protein
MAGARTPGRSAGEPGWKAQTVALAIDVTASAATHGASARRSSTVRLERGLARQAEARERPRGGFGLVESACALDLDRLQQMGAGFQHDPPSRPARHAQLASQLAQV